MKKAVSVILFFIGLALNAQDLHPIEWTDLVGVEYDKRTQSLEIVTPQKEWGKAGAFSMNEILPGEDGKVVFNAIRQSDYRIIGLSSVNTDEHFKSIEYALYLSKSRVHVYLSGRFVGYFGEYKEGDLFSIERKGEGVFFSRNNRVFYNTLVNADKSLYVDVALMGDGPLLEDLSIDTKYVDPIFSTPFSCNDDDKNWVVKKYYNESGNLVSSSKSFTDFLGRPTQSQVKNYQENKVLASQTLYDDMGRPVLNTLPATTDKNYYCYQDNFITNYSGQEYSVNDFDLPNYSNSTTSISAGERDNPRAVSSSEEGTLGWYYSNNNDLEPYQATTSYPYSRVEYDVNNPGRVKRKSKSGNKFKMGSGTETQSYAMPASGELFYVFGLGGGWILGESMYDYQVVKSIVVDSQGQERISFTDGSGKQVASCYSGALNGVNQNNLAVTSYISELGYIDIHLPSGCETTLELYNSNASGNVGGDVVYKILDLNTNRYVLFNGEEEFSGTQPNLSSGYYRIIEVSNFAVDGLVDIGITYELNYYDFSLNYYDKAGRLVRTVSPLGVDQDYSQNLADFDITTDQQTPGIFQFENSISFSEEAAENQIDFQLSEPQGDAVVLTLLDISFTPKNTNPVELVTYQEMISQKSIDKQEPSSYQKLFTLNREELNVRSEQFALSSSIGKFNQPVNGSLNVNKYGAGVSSSCNILATKYIVQFDLYSSYDNLSNETPDIASGANIAIQSYLDANCEFYTTEKIDWGGIIPTEIRLQSNDMLLVVTDVKKINEVEVSSLDVNGNFVPLQMSQQVPLLSDDLDFLDDYKVKIKAENLDINLINHLYDEYEYNSLNWLLSSTTIDGGKTEYNYRDDGEIRFSQNTQQRLDNQFSYTNYDELNRVVELGVYDANMVNNYTSEPILFANHYGEISSNQDGGIISNASTLSILNNSDGIDDVYCREQVFSMYDMPDENFTAQTGLLEEEYKQKVTLGRVSKTWNQNPHTSSTWYSYDERDRVVWMIQKIEGLGVKTFDYEYDLRGNIKSIIYQKGNSDESFYHDLSYDLDGKLLKVKTSVDGTIWKKQAEYDYYLTGELKRVELADQLQGIDYLYTLNGMLKAINSPNIGTHESDRFTDPGGDGFGNGFEQDVFGMAIDYYNGDYYRQGTYVNYNVDGASNYNGNISSVRWNTHEQSVSDQNAQYMYSYDYNHKNWLEQAEYGVYVPGTTQNVPAGTAIQFPPQLGSFTPNFSEDYKVDNISYDLNGNILSLSRNGYTDASASLTNVMDDLVYNYELESGNRVNNKLTHVTDIEHTNTYSDIHSQDVDNYSYDAQGRMIYDASVGEYYDYGVSGLILGVYSDEDYQNPKAKYYYDERGFRIKKELYNTNSNELEIITWFVRDNNGSLISTYSEDPTSNSIIQNELAVYGSNRLGLYNKQWDDYSYELKDHLGNVRALIEKGDDNEVIVQNYSDYYPFGMLMQGRTLSSMPYVFAYQGEFAEYDAENSLSYFEARMWDARIARWHIMDPAGQFASPYLGMGNNPIISVDPDGRIVWVPIIIGAMAGGYTGYKIGDAKGATGLRMFGYILGGAAVGGFSGHIGAAVAAGGGTFASTQAIVVGSFTNSIGMNMLSGGQTDVTVGFGFGSYNFDTGEFGYLGKKGNSALENIGYGFGALANLSDAVTLFRGGGQNIKVNSASTKDEWWGHSSITDENGNSLLSVGPNSPVQDGANLLETWNNSIKGADTGWDTYLGEKGTWSVELNNISTTTINRYATGVTRWDLLLNSCVGHTSRSLWSAGVPNIYFFHPHFLNAQLLIRQFGIYSSPYLYQIP